MMRWLSNLGDRWDRWLAYARAKRSFEEMEFQESKGFTTYSPGEWAAARDSLRIAKEEYK